LDDSVTFILPSTFWKPEGFRYLSIEFLADILGRGFDSPRLHLAPHPGPAPVHGSWFTVRNLSVTW
jgi:hypothetical protein